MEQYRYHATEKVDCKTGCTYTFIDGPSWNPKLHDHDYFEMFLVLDDSVVHYVNGRYQEFSRGTLVFIRPNDVHTFAFRRDIPNSVVNITFTIETIHTLFDYLTAAFPSDEMLDGDMPPSVILSEAETVVLMKKTEKFLDPEMEPDRKAIYIRILLAETLAKYFGDYRISQKEILPKWLDALCREMQKKRTLSPG